MFKKFLIAVSLCLLTGPAGAQTQDKAIAEAGVSKILSFYQNSIKKLSLTGADVQDISLACMGEVYLQWFYNYSDIIQRTPNLNFSDVNNYRTAEQRAHLLETDRMVYNKIRPDVSARILSEIDNRREQKKWSSGPDGLALDNVHETDLLANFVSCRDPDFVTAIDNGYKLNPNDMNQNVTVTVSQYVPRYKNGEAREPVTPVYGGIDDKMNQVTKSYSGWLYEILLR